MDSPLRERISLGLWYVSCVPTAVKIPGLSITQLPLMMETPLWVCRAGEKPHVHVHPSLLCSSFWKYFCFEILFCVCACVCACACVYRGSFGSLLSPVCWCCVLLQESLQSYGSQRGGKSWRNSPSPPETPANTHIYTIYAHNSHRYKHCMCPHKHICRHFLLVLSVPWFHHRRHMFQQRNHKFRWITLLLFFSRSHSSILLSCSLPLCVSLSLFSWKSLSPLSSLQQLVWVGEPFWSSSSLLLCTDLFYLFCSFTTHVYFNGTLCFFPFDALMQSLICYWLVCLEM